MKDTSWCNIEKSFHSPTENTEAKDKPLRLQEYFASEDMNDFHTAGDGRRNQLGGMYVSGKPLSQELRSRIINLSCLGLRQCDISRQLKVTHGCISKLLSKYQETGSMDPAKNAGRPRVITAEIEKKIDQYRRADPGAFCWELREQLLRENVCTVEEVPSLSSISRLVKNKIINEAVEKKEFGTKGFNKCEKGNQPSPFSIASILNIKSEQDIKEQAKKPQCNNHPPNADRFDGDSCSDRKTPLLPRKMYSDEGHPRPQRRERTKFNRVQSLELEREFQKNPYPGIQRRVELACKLAIDESRIQVWFANRRAKGRRRVVSKDNHHLMGNVKNSGRVCPKDPSPLKTSELFSLYRFVNMNQNTSEPLALAAALSTWPPTQTY